LTPASCEECKKRKTKCSGRFPCQSCVARHVDCTFKRPERKVLVSERYLTHFGDSATHATTLTALLVICVRSRTIVPCAAPNQRHRPRNYPKRECPGVALHVPQLPQTSTAETLITNPLVSATSFYLKDTTGRYRYCGPSSSWSFSQRVFLLLKSAVPDYPCPDLPFHIDGCTWELSWSRTDFDDVSVVEGLPSLDDFLYLLNTVKFHSSRMLYLVDEDEFIPHLHEFYDRGLEKAKAQPLWFIQYLLIIALAKAFLTTPRNPKLPPGSAFFTRAMSLVPDFIGLNRQPNRGMQILYLIGLYLVSVDMKDAAYVYVGQAIRMCIMEGIYREPPDGLFGTGFAHQCRNIWWSAYILDRQLSSMIGGPVSIQDAEITCALPVTYDQSADALFFTMHVKLSRTIGRVLNSVYTTDFELRQSFISTIQSVLREMANILRETEEMAAKISHHSLRTVSTMTSHLTVKYHQCIILATRPLFLHFLINRLQPQDQRGETVIPVQLRPLLETSLQSAKISLRTLSVLYEQSLLESFLPFDLEGIFSSAFILTIAHFIDPALVPDMASYVLTASRMLSDIVAKGNMTAALRQKELDLLQRMTGHVVSGESSEADDGRESVSRMVSLPEQTDRAVESEFMMADEEITMSPTQILSLAEHLDLLNESAWDIGFGLEGQGLL
ncbi:hypothetical protein BP00DRAFT_338025, partial [Aspergillus indologenus CBS 114.80]